MDPFCVPAFYTYAFYFLKIKREHSHGATAPYPDHVVDGVHVPVAGVHPDGPQREAELLPRAVDDDGLPRIGGEERGVPARGGVSRGGVRGEGVRR